MPFETASKSGMVFVRLILGKVRVDRVTGPRREIDIRYEFDLKIILKDLKFQIEIHESVCD